MAGGGGFVHRVMSYLVNELLVDSLANSKSFQRFAVRTSKQMEELSNMVKYNIACPCAAHLTEYCAYIKQCIFTAAKKKEQFAGQMKDISETFKDP